MLWIMILWAVGFNWLAYKKGFYTLPKEVIKSSPEISHSTFFSVFGLYIFLALVLPPFAALLLLKILKTSSLSISIIVLFQFTMMLLTFVGVNFLLYKCNAKSFWKIWKNKEREHAAPAEVDFGIGMFVWVLSFPVVSLLTDFLDKILKSYLGLKEYEQAAVKFVRLAMEYPLSFSLAMVSVIAFAPLTEELIFRGVLQNYLKRHLGIKAAILISSFSFALFHFTQGQGMGNITLLVALFFLGGLLGFIYEKQSSLWASIGLHMTFNTISALRIIFFPEVIS